MTLQDVYQRYVVDLDPVLWQMGRVNGIHVDNEKRLALLSEMNHKVAGFVSEAQSYAPVEIHPRKLWKTKPEGDKHLIPLQVPNDKVKTCSRCGLQHVTKTEHTGRKGGRGDVPLNACYKADIIFTPGFDTHYEEVLAFNPGSDDQLRAYASLHRHRLGQNWKTGEDTLDEKAVQKLINKYGEKHDMYRLALQIRKVRKARGYAKAWVPDEKGLLYGQFKNVPETLRLSQSNHNFMNVSHRGNVPYAEELRSLLIAPPGFVLLEADSSSIEAVFSGKFMGSDSYMALATKGIHAAWLCEKLGLEVTKDNIKKVKNPEDNADFWAARGLTVFQLKVMYETKKRTVHGVTYGMGAKLLFESYPEFFANKAEAQAEIDDFYRFVPDLKAWHDDTRKWAHKNGYLQSPWGVRNYYYRVFQLDWATGVWKPGEDAKACIAFQPQHANAMFQRENLMMIAKRGWLQYMTAIGHVHDANGLCVPEERAEEAATMLAEVMNRKIPQMGNIQVGVQVKQGKNWADMKVVLTV